jgi:hypothetical protein
VQRLGLLLFGAIFALLAVGVALAVGVGSSSPSLPPRAVVVLEDAPPGVDVITKRELAAEIAREASARGLKPAPKPGSAEYELLKGEMLYRLIRAAWFTSEARRLGVPVTAKQIAERMQPEETKALKKAGFTYNDVKEHQRWQLVEDNVLNLFREHAGGGQAQQDAAAVDGELELVSDWRFRTHCAEGFITEQCSNFPPFERESWVPRECYETDPKTPAEACPAPVVSTRPATPGSTTPAQPEGDRLVQAPVPTGGGEAEASAE